jgi:hypothetical protein
MGDLRALKRACRTLRTRRFGFAVVLAVACSGVLLVMPALGRQSARSARGSAAARVSHVLPASADIAALPVMRAKMSCASLVARTSKVDGLSVSISSSKTGRATPSSPEYCAVTGHIAKYIGFEILLPTKTWHQRYLQVGCGGLCGSIGVSAPQSTDYGPLAKGYFVVAAEDDGHNGNATDWYSNAMQRVDFAYLSYHDLAVVSKGLAKRFYGAQPKYSYFDGCSQGGHEALGEAQRYPKDFNGVVAGAPASIMTELNSILHEYTYDANYDSSGKTILDQPTADIVLNAAMKACYPKVGLMLDYRACEQKFKLSSVACTATKTTNCLTPAQIGAVAKIHGGPVDPQGEHLYPGGYSLGSEFNWSNPTSANLPATPGASVMPATFITSWLQYFAFEKDIGAPAVAAEPCTKAYFKQIEKLAPFWDATNPNLAPFEKAGGKLILWQGEADWSIPTITSISYYQAVIKAMGGLSATQQFAKYYLLPSVGHCGGNAPDTYNGLGAAVSWAEKGKAPGALTANEYKTTGSGGGPGGGAPAASDLTDAIPALGAPGGPVVRSIKLYPYPYLPAYKGHGSVTAASSYEPQLSTALTKPTPWLGTFDTATVWCNAKGTGCKRRTT